jgi:outer membrane autotransporter protein
MLSGAHAQSVAWGTSANLQPMSFNSNGGLDNMTWQLGWFNSGYTPDGSNYETWVANFNRVSSLTPVPDPMNPGTLVNFPTYRNDGGVWAVSVNTFDVGAAAAGQQMVVFAYNDASAFGTPQGEVLIYQQDGLLFPAAPNQATFDINDNPGDPSDDSFTVFWGRVDREVYADGGVVEDPDDDSVVRVPQEDSNATPAFSGAATFETQSASWGILDEAIFAAAPSILLGSPFGRLPTLEQRVGERIWLHGHAEQPTAGGRRPIAVASEEGEETAASPSEDSSDWQANPLLNAGWVRVIHDQVRSEIGGSREYESDFYGLQLGFDHPLERSEKGIWVLGLTAQAGTLDADAYSLTGSGSLETEGYGVGATATWHGNDGIYADFQGQLNFLENDYSTGILGDFVGDGDAEMLSLSVELGHRLIFYEHHRYDDYRSRRDHLAETPERIWEAGESWGVTPQVQLQWSRLSEHSLTDSRGFNPVEIDAQEEVIGRLGLAVDYRIGDGQAEPMRKIYGIANILHRFTDDPEVFFSAADFTAEEPKTWGELGLGGSMAWYNEPEDRLWQVYGEAAYRRADGGADIYGLHFTLGLRAAW